MMIDTATRRLLAALACTTVLGAAAWAEEETPVTDDTAIEIGVDVGDPPEDGEILPDDGVIVDDGVIFETTVIDDPVVVEDPGTVEDPGAVEDGAPGEDGVVVDGGDDPVAYGPDDCIDCNVGITSVDGEPRGGSEVERDETTGGGTVVSRSEGSAGRPLCASLQPHDMSPCEN